MTIAMKILETSSLGLAISLVFCYAEARYSTGSEELKVLMGALLLTSLFFFISSLLLLIWT